MSDLEAENERLREAVAEFREAAIDRVYTQTGKAGTEAARRFNAALNRLDAVLRVDDNSAR
jgi:hypothetical protein